MNNRVTQSEFARLAGYSRSYVTHLKQAGRLVMDGRKVLVSESIERIEATRDPNRDDVTARHQAAKSGQPVERSEQADSYQSARAMKEKYHALKAKAEHELLIGTLVQASDVRRAGVDIGTTLRTVLENLPDQIAPEIAAIDDPVRVHALLVEHVERILREIGDKIGELAGEGA